MDFPARHDRLIVDYIALFWVYWELEYVEAWFLPNQRLNIPIRGHLKPGLCYIVIRVILTPQVRQVIVVFMHCWMRWNLGELVSAPLTAIDKTMIALLES